MSSLSCILPGVIDKRTEAMMKKPRCGNADQDEEQPGRIKRYIVQGKAENQTVQNVPVFLCVLEAALIFPVKQCKMRN